MDERIYLLLGSNMGDREDYLAGARMLIEEKIGRIESASSLYETAAWGNTGQPEFINQVVSLKSELNPAELLNVILSIEQELGRTRRQKWDSRTIDIDILFYGNRVIKQTALTIPHPQLHLRRFTLAPLKEVAPDLVHPVLNKTINDLFCNLNDILAVRQIKH